jgi:TonB family protein
LPELVLAATSCACRAARFQAWLNEAVAENMVFPAALERSHQNGVATVRFRVGRNGRPADVAIVESSGYRTIDRAALRTIATSTARRRAGRAASRGAAIWQRGRALPI